MCKSIWTIVCWQLPQTSPTGILQGEALARHYMQVMVGNEVMEIPAPAVDITSGTDRFSTSGQYLSGGAYVRRSRFGARHGEVSWNNLNSQDVYLLHKFEEAVIANVNHFMFVDPFGHGNIMPQWLSNHNMKILPGGGFVKGYSLVPVSSMLQHYEVPENTNRHYDFFIPSGYVWYLWADTLYGTDRKSIRLNSRHVAISYAVF